LKSDRYPNWEALQSRINVYDISEFTIKCRGNDFPDTLATVLREVFKARSQVTQVSQLVKTNDSSQEVVLAPSVKVKSTPAEKKLSSKQTFFIGLGISLEVPMVSFSPYHRFYDTLARFAIAEYLAVIATLLFAKYGRQRSSPAAPQ
jgi:hypothetical protein